MFSFSLIHKKADFADVNPVDASVKLVRPLYVTRRKDTNKINMHVNMSSSEIVLIVYNLRQRTFIAVIALEVTCF